MQQIIFIIHILAALALIGLVLIQHGKGADAGAAFGSGASNTMFGSIGSMPFLIKLTGIIAAIFFATCIALGYVTAKEVKQETKTFAVPGMPQRTQTVTLPAPTKAVPVPVQAPAKH